MKFNKILMLAAIALAGTLASCDSDDDNYKKGAEAGAYDVTFAGETNQMLAFTDTEFDVTLTRSDDANELTVPIEVLEAADCFTVPTSATFKAGEKEVTLKVAISEDMKPFTNYSVRLRIPEAYTNPYVANADGNVPEYNVVVLKEDFAVVAVGEFTENILFKQSWDQPIEHSDILGIYRLPDIISEGTHAYFVWDGTDAEDQKFFMCDENGKEVTKFATGYVHPSYGMISWNVLADYWTGYDSEDNAFYFPASMTVSAGSFGSAYETLEILETYPGWPLK